MDKLTTVSKFEDWILNFLSQPSEVFNNLSPCPFAKEAWLKNKVLIREIMPIQSLTLADYFYAELENYSYHWPKEKEVIALVCDPNLITAEELSNAAELANEKFLLNRNYLALEDHPDNIEQVGDVVLNNGNFAIIFLQPLDKLNKAREILKRKNYYKNWTNEYYQEVVGD